KGKGNYGYSTSPATATSIAGLLAGLGDIKVTPEYDFTEKLQNVEGEKKRGHIPMSLRQVIVVQRQTAAYLVTLKRQAKDAEERIKMLDKMLEDGLDEAFPIE